MTGCFSCIFVLAFVIFAPLVSCEEKVSLAVYYETHCPDSRAFILDQLFPVYSNLSDILDVQLYPYGKAFYERKPNGDIEFTCQHGRRECKGNTIQACVLDKYKDLRTQLTFVQCMEQSFSPERDEVLEQCGSKSSLDVQYIKDCSTGSKGTELLLKVGQATEQLSPKLNFVPWINVNGVHTKRNQEDALNNLKKVVCSNYKGTHEKC